VGAKGTIANILRLNHEDRRRSCKELEGAERGLPPHSVLLLVPVGPSRGVPASTFVDTDF
jgi:hypothetical protein